MLAALCLTPRYDLLASADSYVASRPCLAHSALLPASDSRCGMHPFATVGQRSDMCGRNVHSLHQELSCATPASKRRRRTQSSAIISVFYAADIWQLCITFGTDKYVVRYVPKGRHGVDIHMSR